MVQRGALTLGATGVALLAAATAHAGNAGHVPTRVDWSGAQCLTIVDRSTDPTVHIPYGIPFEDTDVTTDEVDDSRRHQFFALCEPKGFHRFLPRWVSQADVEAASLKGIVEPEALSPEEVLETSETWADCWWRITPDDERRPITQAMADEGVDWDTSALPAGNYWVEGYTHEPPKGLWTARPGVYKILDGADPGAVGPAVAVTTPELSLFRDETVTLTGCVDAIEGSVLAVRYARLEAELSWQTYLEDEPVLGESFEVQWLSPEAEWGQTLVIRIDVEDPEGRETRALSWSPMVVTEVEMPCELFCDDTGGATDDAAEATGAEAGSEDDGNADGDEGGGGEDCACRSPRRAGGQAGLPLMLLPLLLRRRAVTRAPRARP